MGMVIKVTGNPVIDGLANKKEDTQKRINALAYERFQLARRIEDIDKDLATYEGAMAGYGLVQKDVDTLVVIQKAQQEAAEAKKKADEEAAKKSNTEIIKEA